WTATRELNGHRDVVLEFYEVPPGHGHARDIRTVARLIDAADSSPLNISHQLRHHIFGFPQYEMLHVRKVFVTGCEKWSSGNNWFFQCDAPGDDLLCRWFMHDHGADHHVVGPL